MGSVLTPASGPGCGSSPSVDFSAAFARRKSPAFLSKKESSATVATPPMCRFRCWDTGYVWVVVFGMVQAAIVRVLRVVYGRPLELEYLPGTVDFAALGLV